MNVYWIVLCLVLKYCLCTTVIRENDSIIKKTEGFLFSVPKILVAGQNESVCLSLHETTVPAKAIIDLKWKEKHFSTVRNFYAEHTCFDLFVPYLEISDPQFVSIRAQVQINNVIKSAHNQDPILLYPKKITKTFINTDRDIYKPGDKVKFRIFVIDDLFLPQNSELPIIKLKNPLDITVSVWNKIKPENGMVSLEYQMVPEDMTGKWKIEISGESKTFEVFKYVLPRFKIDLSYPKLIYYKANSFDVKVCGQYSHGRYVKGLAFVKVTDSYNNMAPIHRMKEMIDGCSTFSITSQELMFSKIKEKSPMYDPKMHVHITATVTERGTNRMDITTGKSLVFLKAYTMKFISSPIFRPSLPYKGQIKLNNVQANLTDEVIEICYNVAVKKSWNYLNGEQCSNFSVGEDNIVNFSIFPMRSNIIHIHLNARSLNHTEIGDSLLLVRLFSPSGSYISLQQSILNNTDEECRAHQQFSVHYTTDRLNSGENITFYYMIKTPSRIFKLRKINHSVAKKAAEYFDEIKNWVGGKQKFIKLGTGIDHFLIKFRLDKRIGSRYQILVYYVTSNGETVAATKNVEVEPCLLKVDAKWKQSQMAPGATATINIKTGSHSICSISAVDKSMQFFSENHRNFNINTLLKSFIEEREYPASGRKTCVAPMRKGHASPLTLNNDGYNSVWDLRRRKKRHIYSFSEDFDTYDVFDNFGTVTITNLRIVTKHCYTGPILKDNKPVQFLTEQYEDHNEEKFVSVRSYFPETWLWEMVPVSEEIQLKRHLPHSITNWVTNVLCISNEDGIGFSEETEITSFQSFFVEIITPYSVKRDESFYLYIHVSNYLNYNFPIRITLRLSEGLALKDQNENPVVSYCLQENSTVTHTVKVKGTKIGSANVTVLAELDNQYPQECGPETVVSKRDIVLKSIQVESEGYPMTLTKSALLCDTDTNTSSNISWRIVPHEDIIPGTETAYIHLNGDLMGKTIENLEQLLEVPTGCGEQIMASMVPNLYILRYLNATHSLKSSIRHRIIRNLKIGYQRILNYIHKDGSFSAFGYHDTSGSMFLTAFVVRTLNESKDFVYIDQKIIDRAVAWIFDHQLENGCFNTMLHVFQDMGGTSKENSTASLTAYVIVSLMEANIKIPKSVQTNARYCIRSQHSPDTYTLAISCYALYKIQWTSEADKLLNKLLALSNQQRNMMWWSNKENSSLTTDIEITGYVLLSLLHQNTTENLANAHAIVRWLSTKFSAKGSFKSTQDTVIALDALTKYSRHIKSRSLDLEITINADNKTRKVNLKSEDKLKSKQLNLDKNVTEVKVLVSGQGCVLAQVTHSYYLRNVPKSETFKLDLDVAPVSTIDQCSITSISPCLAYVGPDGTSNMAVMELTLPSGYEADRASLYKLVDTETASRVKMFEELKDKVNIYFTKLDKHLTCFSFNINENSLVESRKDSLVKLYDYYRPEYEIIQFYKINNCYLNSSIEIPEIPEKQLIPNTKIDNEIIAIPADVYNETENIVKRSADYLHINNTDNKTVSNTGLNPDFVDRDIDMDFSNCNGNIPSYERPSKNVRRNTRDKPGNENKTEGTTNVNPIKDFVDKDINLQTSKCYGNIPFYTVREVFTNRRIKRDLEKYIDSKEKRIIEMVQLETQNEEMKAKSNLNALFFNMEVDMEIPKGMEGNMPIYVKPTSEELNKMNST